MKPATHTAAFALMLALIAPTPLVSVAMAQQAKEAPPKDKPSDALSIPVTEEQARAAEAERERLNEEQARLAQEQLAQNDAGRADYQRELREREATIARQQAEAQAAQAAYEAEVARRQAEHEAAMARWRADVAACEAGDVSRCADEGVPK